MVKNLVIIGFGGNSRSVADVANSCGYKNFFFVDKNAKPNESFLGHPVIKDFHSLNNQWIQAFPGSGDTEIRRAQINEIENAGLELIPLVSSNATQGIGSSIGLGSFIGHHAHIGPMSMIGVGCIINTAAVVEHECSIGDLSHISVNATVAGRSVIGKNCMIGAGATVIDKIQVCDNVIIGAGSLCIRSIDEPGIYVGVPLKKVGSQQ